VVRVANDHERSVREDAPSIAEADAALGNEPAQTETLLLSYKHILQVRVGIAGVECSSVHICRFLGGWQCPASKTVSQRIRIRKSHRARARTEDEMAVCTEYRLR